MAPEERCCLSSGAPPIFEVRVGARYDRIHEIGAGVGQRFAGSLASAGDRAAC